MGLTAPKAAAALGVSYSGTYRDWLAGVSRNTGKPVQISQITALACAALAAGLGPWSSAPTNSNQAPGGR